MYQILAPPPPPIQIQTESVGCIVIGEVRDLEQNGPSALPVLAIVTCSSSQPFFLLPSDCNEDVTGWDTGVRGCFAEGGHLIWPRAEH